MSKEYLKGKNQKSPSVDDKERFKHNFRSNRSSKPNLNNIPSTDSLDNKEINKLLKQYSDFEEH